jgi:hypothetical protein
MPTVTIGDNTGDDFSGTEDARIMEANATTNYGSASQIEIDKFSASNWVMSLLRFTGLSSISGPVTVSSATLNIWWESGASPAQTISARQCIRNWVEAELTWNVFSTGNNWGTAGGLNDSTDRVSTIVADAAVSGVGSPRYISLTGAGIAALVEGWINSSITNHGFHVERTDAQNDSSFALFTSSEGSDGQRPYLEVTYEAAAASGSVVPSLPQRNRRHTGRYS